MYNPDFELAKTQRFYCSLCRGRYPQKGDCPRCPGEPLWDLFDGEVRQHLEDEDARNRQRRYQRAVLASLPFGIASCIGASAVLGSLIAVFVAAAVCMGIASVIMKLFPPTPLVPYASAAEWQTFEKLVPWMLESGENGAANGAPGPHA